MPTRIVLCARELHAPAWLEALRAALPEADLWWRDAARLDAEPLAPQADIAIVWRPPPAFFDEQRRLCAVFNLGAGVDALLAMPNFPRDVPLVRLEDAGMANAAAEYALAAVLRVYRGFDRYAIRQRQARWQAEVLLPKSNFSVGVLGLGAIGGAVARALAAHVFAVRGFARTRKRIEGVDCRAVEAEFGSFLDALDVLVSVLPLTSDNRGAPNRANLERLADGAHVVNVGRGAHLVEADLLALIDAGKLGGATLDVSEDEPLLPDHPFWQRPEILVTLHVGAVTELAPSVAQVAEKIARLQRADAIAGVVDLRRGC